MKKKWKFRLLAVLVMAIMTLAVACAPTKEESVDTKKEVTEDVQEPVNTAESGTDKQTNNDDASKVEEPADTENPGAEEEPTKSEDPGTVEEPAGGDEQASDVKTVKGTFGGLADPHTFELKTNAVPEGVMAFQFYDEEIGAKLDAMEEGTELTVVYKTNEYGQNLVESIE